MAVLCSEQRSSFLCWNEYYFRIDRTSGKGCFKREFLIWPLRGITMVALVYALGNQWSWTCIFACKSVFELRAAACVHSTNRNSFLLKRTVLVIKGIVEWYRCADNSIKLLKLFLFTSIVTVFHCVSYNMQLCILWLNTQFNTTIPLMCTIISILLI